MQRVINAIDAKDGDLDHVLEAVTELLEEHHKLMRELEQYKAGFEDTMRCWIATRINGASASMACDGEINMHLLSLLDRHIGDLK